MLARGSRRTRQSMLPSPAELASLPAPRPGLLRFQSLMLVACACLGLQASKPYIGARLVHLHACMLLAGKFLVFSKSVRSHL